MSSGRLHDVDAFWNEFTPQEIDRWEAFYEAKRRDQTELVQACLAELMRGLLHNADITLEDFEYLRHLGPKPQWPTLALSLRR